MNIMNLSLMETETKIICKMKTKRKLQM